MQTRIDTVKTRIIQPLSDQGNVTVLGDLNVMGSIVSDGNTTSTKIIFEQGIVIGNSVTSALGGPDAITIGKNSSAGPNSITIGLNAGSVLATGTTNMCIGEEAGATLTTGKYNICLGHNSNPVGTVANVICIGTNSYTQQFDSIAIGRDSIVSTSRGVAVGAESKTRGGWALSIGYRAGPISSSGTGAYNVAVGGFTLNAVIAGAISNVAIGGSAGRLTTTGLRNTFIGHSARSADTVSAAVVIGAYSTCNADYSVAIGAGGNANSGRSSKATGINAIAIGGGHLTNTTTAAYAKGASSIAIGGGSATDDGSYASGLKSIAIGTRSDATSSYTIAIGFEARSTTTDSITIGKRSRDFGISVIAIGYRGYALGNGSISIGRNVYSGQDSNYSIAIGGGGGTFHNTNRAAKVPTSFVNAIAIGGGHASVDDTGAYAKGISAIAIGGGTVVRDGAYAGATDAISIGRHSAALGIGSITIGHNAGAVLATGADNIAIGQNALNSVNNVLAFNNVAIGKNAGTIIQSGSNNICIGDHADAAADTANVIAIGTNSTATGGLSIVIGGGARCIGNCAVSMGFQTYTTADDTVAIGKLSRGAGVGSIAIGVSAGSFSGTGADNIAIGRNALNSMNNVLATENVAIGTSAGTAITSGAYNVCVGHNAGAIITTADDNVCVGNSATVSTTSITGAVAIGSGITANANNGFFVTRNGAGSGTTAIWNGFELEILTSARRFKENIRELENVSEKIDLLQPQRFKSKLPPYRECIGLIAEEVELVFPELVTWEFGKDGKPTGLLESVMYEHFVSILIKEVQRLKEELREQNTINTDILQRLVKLENLG